MKIKESILSLLTVSTRLKLGLALGFSEQWVIKCIGANKENGPLTKAAALKVISEELGLPEGEILETCEQLS